MTRQSAFRILLLLCIPITLSLLFFALNTESDKENEDSADDSTPVSGDAQKHPAVVPGAAQEHFALASTVPTKGFRELTQAFFKQNCLDCHGKDEQEGKQAFHQLFEVNEANKETWEILLEQVASGQMPPDPEDAPGTADIFHFQRAVINEIARFSKKSGGYHKYEHPDKGNFLSHDLLFTQDLKKISGLEPASTPARLWRIHPAAYLVRIDDLVHRAATFNPKRPGLRVKGDAIPGSSVHLGSDHVRLFRYSAASYTAFLPSIQKTLGMNGERGLQNYASLYSVPSAGSRQLIANAQEVIKYMIYGSNPDMHFPKGTVTPPKKYKKKIGYDKLYYLEDFKRKRNPVNEIMEFKGKPSRALLEKTVRFYYEKLICRAPTTKELKEDTNYLEGQIQSVGKEQGVINGLTPLFVHIEALFSLELAENGTPDQYGRVPLKDHELAMAINGAFRYLPPDSLLRQAVDSGKLKTREDVRREVTRLLNTPEIRKPRIARFFQEYFDYHRAREIDKDENSRSQAGLMAQSGSHGLAVNRVVNNLDRLIKYIVDKDKNVLSELLTTRKAIIGADNEHFIGKAKKHTHGKSDGVALYGEFTGKGIPKKKYKIEGYQPVKVILPPTEGEDIYISEAWNIILSCTGTTSKSQLVDLDPKQRIGVLTDPAWLHAHSDSMDNHAVLRGRWIREKLLGQAVPDVPITVDAQLPDEPKSTLRHRMRVTKETYCWKCHQKMDPLGLPFEMFNHIGLYRKLEMGKPVDATGEIIASGDPKLDGPVKNAIEMIEKLAKSERVNQVFVRYAFRYWMGRNETVNDAPTLRAAYKAYKDNGGSMKALITSLLTSDSFLYRKVK